MIRTEEMLLNVDPQHPSTHGVFRLVIKIDGKLLKKLHRLLDICIADRKDCRELTVYANYPLYRSDGLFIGYDE